MPLLRPAAIVALTVALAAAHAEPLVHRQASFYYVEGNSAVLLAEQIGKAGPEGADRKRHPTLTKWHVQWRFRPNLQGSVCKMGEVVVIVGLITMRPRWRGEANGPSVLRERWNRLIEAVDRNQAYHTEQATLAGSEIEAQLRNTPPAADCDALTEAANKTASAILEKYQQASDEHDRTTDYGRTYGASLI